MSSWKFLRAAALYELIFGGKKHNPHNSVPHSYNFSREAELDEKYDRLSARIDELKGRLDEVDYESDLYDDLQDELDDLRNDLDFLEDERFDYDDY